MSTLKATNIKNESSASNNIVLDSGGGVVVSGILTATSFSGEATGLTGTPNLNVGIVTATSFVGDGSGLTSLDAADISSGTLAIARGGTNSTATATAGGAAYGTGSAFAFTSAGTSGQVLTSNGTSAPTWADAGGGAWTYISSVTASNSASVAFTSGIDSTYDNYVIIGSNIKPSVDTTLSTRVSNNGGSSYSTANYGSRDYDSVNNTPFDTSAGSGQWNITDRNIVSAGIGLFIYLYLFSPATSSTYHLANMRTYYECTSAGAPVTGHDAMLGYSNTTTYNAIQFYPSSGNIASGTFRLYGIKNS